VTIEARFHLTRDDFVLEANLWVPSRGVSAILGPSGCGKTTFLRAIAGLENSGTGYLKVGDEIWQDRTRHLPTHQRSLGYVFQESSLFPHLTVRGNLEYGFTRVPDAERRVDFDEAVELLGLGSFLDRDPAGLSGGERQRVAIARAILTSPRLLLMDEPLAALDSAARNGILPYLERLHRQLEIPVLYVTHSQDEAARLADYLVLMEAGKVLASGPLGEILTRVDLPLAHRDGAVSVVETTVAGHDDEYSLARLSFAGGEFLVARTPLIAGLSVRLQILARDVSVTLERQVGTSILNIFPAEVHSVSEESAAQVTVGLDVGGVPILSRITRRSAEALDLAPGKQVFAQIKSVALLN
jgi:molybdate transport system ATP-binding protein